MTEDKNKVHVSESKFNGTATFEVTACTKKQAKTGARKYWREEYNTRPSRIVAEKRDEVMGDNSWYVMISDHSSGSLKDLKDYEISHPDEV